MELFATRQFRQDFGDTLHLHFALFRPVLFGVVCSGLNCFSACEFTLLVCDCHPLTKETVENLLKGTNAEGIYQNYLSKDIQGLKE
jgi:hypothetical protein